MTFYLIGLGLNEKSISLEALEALKKCGRVYLESYTVDFPYKTEDLEKVLKLKAKIEKIGRENVESEKFLDEAGKENIALLVYGDVLTATTHISLILKCRKDGIRYKIIHNASVFNVISDSGLSMYKFGKITSIPEWKESFTPDSFADIIKENLKIKAHALILVDIGLEFEKAKEELRTACSNKKIYLDKIVVCSALGTEKQKFYYDKLDNLKDVEKPFCFLIPGELNHVEKEALEVLSE